MNTPIRLTAAALLATRGYVWSSSRGPTGSSAFQSVTMLWNIRLWDQCSPFGVHAFLDLAFSPTDGPQK